MAKVFKHKILLFIIFLISLGTFLRFYNLPNLYIFGFDEEYQANYAMTLVKDFHPIWIGVSASFIDYYMGPYFTYFTAFWLWISKGDPLITAYVAGLTGVITSVAVFFVGWRFFNLTTGVAASLLYAGLPLFVFYDQKYWNPMFVQLIVLAMLVSLMLIKKSYWWWLLFVAAVGTIFETDLAPLPLAFIGLWLFIKGRYFLNKKLVLGCLTVFLVIYWPLIVFDFNHNFSNLRVFNRYQELAKEAGVKLDPTNKFLSFADTMGRFWYLIPGRSNTDELNISCSSLSTKPEFKFIDRYSERTNPPLWLSALSIISFLYFLIKSVKSREDSHRLLTYFLLVSLGFYLIYTGGSFEYYLHGFITLFTLAVGVVVSQASKKIKPLFIILIIAVLAAGFNTVINSSDKFSLGPKKQLIGELMTRVEESSFSIDGMGICHNWEGWRYLFKAYGKVPAKSYTDSSFGWLYPEELNDKPIIYEVILSESRIPSNKDISGYDKIERGGYSAYIRKIK